MKKVYGILKLLKIKNLVDFNDISEGKSPVSISGRITIKNCYLPQRPTQRIRAITNRKLQWEYKSPSEVVNIAAPQEMI